jgi:hypothetical protein
MTRMMTVGGVSSMKRRRNDDGDVFGSGGAPVA